MNRAVSRHSSSISLEKTAATIGKKNKKAGKGKHNKAALERQNQANLATNSDSNQASAATPNTTSFRMKFKTEICKFWQLHGFCEYGEACSFAHGNDELLIRKD